MIRFTTEELRDIADGLHLLYVRRARLSFGDKDRPRDMEVAIRQYIALPPMTEPFYGNTLDDE